VSTRECKVKYFNLQLFVFCSEKRKRVNGKIAIDLSYLKYEKRKKVKTRTRTGPTFPTNSLLLLVIKIEITDEQNIFKKLKLIQINF